MTDPQRTVEDLEAEVAELQARISDLKENSLQHISTTPQLETEKSNAQQYLDVAEIILFMLQRPAHVNIADVLVLPSAQASASLVKRKN